MQHLPRGCPARGLRQGGFQEGSETPLLFQVSISHCYFFLFRWKQQGPQLNLFQAVTLINVRSAGAPECAHVGWRLACGSLW